MKKYLPILAITLLGLVVRLYNLTSISLWHDEAFSALLIKYPWVEMMHRIALDVHPPMYYIFLRLWHYLFGDSLFALRGFSVFFGIALIPLAYLFVEEIFKNKRAAIIAAIAVALNPFSIQYVTEARMYTMGAFFGLLTAYLLAKAIHAQKAYILDEKLHIPNLPKDINLKRYSIIFYILFAVSAGISILTHYYLLFTIAAICFYGLIFHLKNYGFSIKRYLWLCVSYLSIAILFLPWLKVFLFQLKQVGAGYWIPPIDRWSIPTTVWQLLIGWNKDIAKPENQILVTITTVFVIGFTLWFLKKQNIFEKWLVALAFIAPFGGSIAFYLLSQINGHGTSVFLVRYFLFASPFLSVVIALWMERIKPKQVGIFLSVLYFILCLYSNFHFWDDLNVSSKPGMAAAAKYLKNNVAGKDKLYVASSFEFFNYKYYNQTEVQPFLYSGGKNDISQMSHFEGTAILTNEDLVPDFTKATTNGDTVWLVWTNGFGGQKPTLPKNWYKISEQSYAEVRPYVGTYIYVEQYKVN